MTVHAQDWTGSAAQRAPQRSCAPPKLHPGPIQCDWIPAGTPVLVRPKRGTSKDWKHHTTKIDLRITETIRITSHAIMFVHGDWVVSASRTQVRITKRRKIPTSDE